MQAIARQELQGVIEVCSRSFSAWFMAHIPDLLSRHPAAPATLGRFLPHFGSDQVCLLDLCPLVHIGNIALFHCKVAQPKAGGFDG